MSHNVTIFVTLLTLPIKLQWFQGVTSRRLLGVFRLSGRECLGSAPQSINPDGRMKFRDPPFVAHKNDARICVARGMPIGRGWYDALCHGVMTHCAMMA